VWSGRAGCGTTALQSAANWVRVAKPLADLVQWCRHVCVCACLSAGKPVMEGKAVLFKKFAGR